MILELNTSQINGQHLQKLNLDLEHEIKLKDIEIEGIQKQINDNYTIKLRTENKREELTEFSLQNPYDKKNSKKKSSRPPTSPVEQNQSTFTQNTNFAYSENSQYSGVHRHGTNILNKYMQTGQSINANSLEGTFVSKREDYADNTITNIHNASYLDEYGSDNYNVDSMIFNKYKESSAGNTHNMTFGDENQHFRFKISEKKVDWWVYLIQRKVSTPSLQLITKLGKGVYGRAFN